MSKLLESVDQRTQLVGQNRLELLTFRLNSQQLYAINVFKVQEVVSVPHLTEVPYCHPVVTGVTHLRENTIPVLDLSRAIGGPPLRDRENGNMIVTEYNRSVQGFLVGSVDRILNLNWETILPPPDGMGRNHFLTAITRYEDKIIQILDVEQVAAEIIAYDTDLPEGLVEEELVEKVRARQLKILMADDSPTAISQVRETLSHLGIELIEVQDGLKAWELLQQWVAEGVDVYSHIVMLLTDAEMPEMDGYRLTHEIRQHPQLKDLHVVLHTSLSGSFNKAMVEKVGCDGFMSKFQPEKLAVAVQERLHAFLDANP